MDIEGKIRIPTIEDIEKIKTKGLYIFQPEKLNDFINLFWNIYYSNQFWTSSVGYTGDFDRIKCYHYYGGFYIYKSQKIGCRIILPYSEIKDVAKIVSENSDFLEIECFSYPKNLVDEAFQKKLQRKFYDLKVNKTGKTYTVNAISKLRLLNYKELIEYEYQGVKYIRIVEKGNHKYDYYWIKVEPITFVVFKDLDIAISKDIVFAGIPFNDKEYYGDFSTTILYKYLNEIFAKDIIPSETKEEEIIQNQTKEEETIQNQTKIKEYSKNVNVDEEKEI